MRYALTVPVLEAARLGLGCLPHGAALALGRWLGRLGWLTARHARRLAHRQIEEAGLARGKEARRLTRQTFETIGMSVTEFFNALAWSDEDLRRKVRIEGLENLRSAQKPGKGVIIAAAHMGNWELMPWAYGAHTGQSVAALMAQQGNSALNRWLADRRERRGSRLIPVTEAGVGLIRHLKRGGLLAILADQDSTRSRGIFVPFFGRPAYTPAGPAQLARLTGASILPVTIARDGADPQHHTIHVDPPLWADPDQPETEDAARLTAAFTAAFETRIRLAPAQWVWIHDRWRHRPGQRIRVRSAGRMKRPTSMA